MESGNLLDRLALLICAVPIVVGLAWLAFHPLAVAALQIAAVVAALVWRANIRLSTSLG